MECVEQEVFSCVPFHQVVASVPIHAAPVPVTDLELMTGDLVKDLTVLFLDLGDLPAADHPRVADLSSASGIECSAPEGDVIPFNGGDLSFEFGNVSIVMEQFIGHGIT